MTKILKEKIQRKKTTTTSTNDRKQGPKTTGLYLLLSVFCGIVAAILQ